MIFVGYTDISDFAAKFGLGGKVLASNSLLQHIAEGVDREGYDRRLEDTIIALCYAFVQIREAGAVFVKHLVYQCQFCPEPEKCEYKVSVHVWRKGEFLFLEKAPDNIFEFPADAHMVITVMPGTEIEADQIQETQEPETSEGQPEPFTKHVVDAGLKKMDPKKLFRNMTAN